MADSEMSVLKIDVSTTEGCSSNVKEGKTQVVVADINRLTVSNDAVCEQSVPGLTGVEIDTSAGCDQPDGNPDPEAIPDSIREKPWHELTSCQRFRQVTVQWLGKPLAVVVLLYFFICSLDLLSSAFRLVGGKAAGNAFSSSVIIQNPVAGLMVGILSTVLVQSSSTSTSIVVAMVSSGILDVRPAIPIIMGANIGTSVTNTIVSLAQSNECGQFELAFAGATVHDMFNWLAVIVLLPLEVFTGCLYHLTRVLVTSNNFTTVEGANKDILKAITKPLTELVVQLDKEVIQKLALGHQEYQNRTLLKQWCQYAVVTERSDSLNATLSGKEGIIKSLEFIEENGTLFAKYKQPTESCEYLLKMIPLNDLFLGLILMVVSLTLLCTCLVLIVKILNSALKGPVSVAAKKIINKDLPGRCSYMTGYLAIIAGAGLTIVVQSSSVFTSTLTPLVGMNIISLERMYPLTLGSNIGTTTTGLLAAMAASGDKLQPALQIALVHLFFNITAIILFYPVPFMRFPIPLARLMGRTTAKYRWFAVAYLIGMFFLLPGCLFALSIAGSLTFITVSSLALSFIAFLVTVNVLKKKLKKHLPAPVLRFLVKLPKAFYSLAPLDNVLHGGIKMVKACLTCCRTDKAEDGEAGEGMLSVVIKPGNDSFLDQMTEEERKDYESTVRSLEEVKVMLTSDVYKSVSKTGTDSGYVTQLHTPYLSKFPSKEDFAES